MGSCQDPSKSSEQDRILEFQEILRKKLSNFLFDSTEQTTSNFQCTSEDEFEVRPMSIENPKTNTPKSEADSCRSTDDSLDKILIYKCPHFNSNETIVTTEDSCNNISSNLISCSRPNLKLPTCVHTDIYCKCTPKPLPKQKKPMICSEEKPYSEDEDEDIVFKSTELDDEPESPQKFTENRIIGNQFIGTFLTGTSYRGDWDIEMSGFGKYRFVDGTEYHGNFKCGDFHGKGVFIMPNKFRVEGIFENGACLSYKIFFPDGLEYKTEDWDYCKYPDRRYWAEIQDGVLPVGDSFLTPSKEPQEIPEGCFDVLDGFLHEDTGFLLNTNEPHERIRYVLQHDRKWILENCRKNKRETIGQHNDIIEQNEASINKSSFFKLLQKVKQGSDIEEDDSCVFDTNRPLFTPRFPKL